MKSMFLKLLALAALLMSATGARAADTDLFAWVNTNAANSANVLFVIDNGASFSANANSLNCYISTSGVVSTAPSGTASWATNLNGKGAAIEQCALYESIKSLETSTTSQLYIGVMMMNANGMKSYDANNADTASAFSNVCRISNSSIGGCLVLPIVQFTAATKPRILEWIRKWDINGNSNYEIKGPASLVNGAAMQEAWAYLQGATGISGRSYSAIRPPIGCGKHNIIFIGNNYGGQASPKDGSTAAESPLSALRGTLGGGKNASPAADVEISAAATPIIETMRLESCSAPGTFYNQPLPTAENKGAYAPNWAWYMKSKHDITTFAIGVAGPSCDADYAAHLAKLGELGQGGYIQTTDFTTLKAAISEVLSKIMAVNSVFAAVSLPVSVNTQGSYLNQVYVGMFRPAPGFSPRWRGNLKQYKLGFKDAAKTSLQLQDGDSKSAINALTGFITECARSFWTPQSTDSYWLQQSAGGCTSIGGSAVSDYPDGNIVEKGAQGYMLRSNAPTARRVKTCSPSMADCTGLTAAKGLTDFNTANALITTSKLGISAGSTTLQLELIKWAMGYNTTGELDKTTTVIRPSVHGDVVHSRPVAVNHGGDTEADRRIVVYYGANDGMLHAVNGNRTGTVTYSTSATGSTTFAAGQELWSFMPPEFYGSIKRQYDDTPNVSYPGSPVANARAKDYGIDGPITSFRGTINGTTKTIIYATMRRGGRVIYAFDVTEPGKPALLWKKGCPNIANDTDCSAGFADIGQTWSSLKLIYANAYKDGSDVAKPMLIMGGGYDDCEDFDGGAGGANHNCTATTKGKKLYLLDAGTGEIVRSFDTVANSGGVARGIIADSTIINDSSTGLANFAYTADLGGNVYRVSLTGNTTASWAMTRIASLGCDTPTNCTAPRKFMFHPSVVKFLDQEVYAVNLGTGDREKPVESYAGAKAVRNYFFSILDNPVSGDAAFSSEIGTCGLTPGIACMASLEDRTTNNTAALDSTSKGWKIRLDPSEQVVTSAVTIFGVTNFSTHKPAVTSPDACSTNLGSTQLYKVDFKTGAAAVGDDRSEDVSGDGLPPSPVAGIVQLDDGTQVPFCIGCSKDSPLEGELPKDLSSVAQPKGRLYWYIDQKTN